MEYWFIQILIATKMFVINFHRISESGDTSNPLASWPRRNIVRVSCWQVFCIVFPIIWYFIVFWCQHVSTFREHQPPKTLFWISWIQITSKKKYLQPIGVRWFNSHHEFGGGGWIFWPHYNNNIPPTEILLDFLKIWEFPGFPFGGPGRMRSRWNLTRIIWNI